MNYDFDGKPDLTDPNITEEDLEALKSEAEIMDAGDHTVTAERLFKENLPSAVLQIVKLSSGASSDRVRLDASRYIVERNMGRLQDIVNLQGNNPLEQFLKLVHNKPEEETDDQH